MSRTPIGSFIHTTWTNLNIRCANGKYKHLATKSKSRFYDDVYIEITREEYKELCLKNKNTILSLDRPSVDRKDSKGNYSIKNIQFIELRENILKDKKVNHLDGFGECSKCKEIKKSDLFAKDNRRESGYGTICKKCDNDRGVK